MNEYRNCLKCQMTGQISSDCNKRFNERLQLNIRVSFMRCQRLSIIIIIVDTEYRYISHMSNFELQNVQNQFIYHFIPQTAN